MLVPCPVCGADNIEGADTCESCGAALAELSERAPRSSVEACLMADTVDELTLRPHASIPPETTLGEALRLMVDTSVGCLTIVDQQGRLAGLFSERDAVTRVGGDAATKHDHPISKFMTPNPVTLKQHAKIALALQQMDIGGYRHMPVLDQQDRPVMLISIRDILGYLTERIAAPE